jgi:hypothetical protein
VGRCDDASPGGPAQLTYRAHCLGVRLRRLVKRHRRRLINGKRYAWSSVAITFNGQEFTALDSISYSESREPEPLPVSLATATLTGEGLTLGWPKT